MIRHVACFKFRTHEPQDDFADKEALLRYYRHPAVRAVIDQIVSVAASRISVDFEVR